MLASIFTIKNIIIAALIGGVIYLFLSWQHRGEEMERMGANYENALLQLDQDNHQKFAEFEFKRNGELQHYLEMNDNMFASLTQKLDETNIKLRKITQIVSTTIHSRDTIISVLDLDSLAQKIRFGKPFAIPFEDKTECFYFKAQFVYENGISRIEVLDREYNDTINQVSHWERQQWKFLFIKTRLFGKKVVKVTLFNNCGDAKTIVIKKD